MELKELIKRMRLSRGMSTVEAADKLSISAQYLSRLENGRQKPSEALLLKMKDVYQLAPEDATLLLSAAGLETANVGLGQVVGGQQMVMPSMVKLDPLKTPIYYTNALFVSSDEFGINVDAGQKAPNNEIQIVTRIGLSLEHAVRLHQILGEHISRSKKLRSENTPQ